MVAVDAKEIAIALGYSYLDCNYGEWKDNSGTIKTMNSMSEKYLSNCVNFINRGIKEIEEGKIDGEIKDKIKSFSKKRKISDECLETVKSQMVSVLKFKREQIEEV